MALRTNGDKERMISNICIKSNLTTKGLFILILENNLQC